MKILEETEIEGGYFLRVVDRFEEPHFRMLVEKHFHGVFSIIDSKRFLSKDEQAATETLKTNLKERFHLRVGIFQNEKLVAWNHSWQDDDSSLFMTNSCVLPEHRRKGLYTEILNKVIKIAVNKGFQAITSKHVVTNNDVIIPKLKAGFVITGMEVHPNLGTLVRLAYFPNRTRKKLLDVRAGLARSDSETDALFLSPQVQLL